jgi:hypothetical protein
MNTLSKYYTANFFASQDEFVALRKHWSALVNSDRKHELKAVHHLLYLVLTGKDWRKAFSFPTNKNKLNNGYIPEVYNALDLLSSTYSSASVLRPFDGLVTPEMLDEVRKVISHAAYTRPLWDAEGNFRCDAYANTEPAIKEKLL